VSYQIKMVSEMLGIPKNTLIAWERRYRIVDPDRTDGGYRVYSDRDVAVLRRVQTLLDQGYKIGEACHIVLDEADRVPVEPVRPAATDLAALAAIKDQLKERLLVFDRAGADRIGTRLVVVPFEAVIDAVYFPLLREVGQAWEAGRVSVVQEHYITAYCREKLLVMLNAVQSGLTSSPEITCATPPGEHHELGLLALALRLALRGFRVVYLGTNVPTTDLAEHVNKRRPAGLCLSMVHGREPAEILAYLRDLRMRVDPAVRVVVGGRATEGHALDVEGVELAGHGLPAWLETGPSGR
jgi:DNA-binding transcriptional MerR regulator/methylmalonyl-CoA mutase cobalamin-binding subunit